jgi:hypothetical protein
MNSRLVAASISVSRFSSAVSRVRRMSAGEKRLNTSSVDSGSSQNCLWEGQYGEWRRGQEGSFTEAQYGSSAAMALPSESLKMPRLNTSFESEAPMVISCGWHLTFGSRWLFVDVRR